jgi:hypothetical protein
MEIVRRWHIYAIISPETGKPVYVGRTYGAVGGRFSAHFRAPSNKPLGELMRGWLLKSLLPTVEVLEKGSGDCRGAERKWIAQLRGWGYALMNRSPGGEATRLDPAPAANKKPTGPSGMLRIRRALEYATWNGRPFKVNY